MSKNKENKDPQNNRVVEAQTEQSGKPEEKIIKKMISGEEIVEGITKEVDLVKKNKLFSLKQYVGQVIGNLDEMSAKDTVFTSIKGFGPCYGTDYCGGFDKEYAYLYIGDMRSRSMRNLRTYLLRCLAINGNKIYVEDPGYMYREDFANLMRKESDDIWGRIFLSHKTDELKRISKNLTNYDISWFKADYMGSLLGKCVPCMETPDIFFINLSYEEFISKPSLPQQIAKERKCVVIAFIDKKDNRKSEFEPMEENLIEQLMVHLPEANVFNLETIGHDINFVWDTHDSEMHADGEAIVEFDLTFVLTLSKEHAYLESNKEYHYHDNYMEWYVREEE